MGIRALREGSFLSFLPCNQSGMELGSGMNLDCRVLSAACPRVFEECRDAIRHGLSTEKAKSPQSTQGKVKKSEEKHLKPWLLGFVLAARIGSIKRINSFRLGH